MKYCVGRGVIGPSPFLDISAEEFEMVKKAKRNISILLGLEQKFEIRIDNYIEYEQNLLSLALGHLVSHTATWADFHSALSLINRKLANLLTVSRLYIHQVKHDISTIYGRQAETCAKVGNAFVVQSERLFGYRVMEEIRNLLQHRSLPISRLEYPTGWESRGDGQLLHHCSIAKVQIQDLRDDKRFNQSVLRQLDKRETDAVDITPFVRQYVEGLSCVQNELREITNEDVNIWKLALQDMIERYSVLCGEEVKIAVVYRTDDQDRTAEEVTLVSDAIDQLQLLRRKRPPTYLSQAYVSNIGS